MLKNLERGSKNRVIGKIYCSEIVSMTYCVLFSAMHNFLDHFSPAKVDRRTKNKISVKYSKVDLFSKV